MRGHLVSVFQPLKGINGRTDTLKKLSLKNPPFLFQPLKGINGRTDIWRFGWKGVGYARFNPSKESTAVLTVIQTEEVVKPLQFQPLKGINGRTD